MREAKSFEWKPINLKWKPICLCGSSFVLEFIQLRVGSFEWKPTPSSRPVQVMGPKIIMGDEEIDWLYGVCIASSSSVFNFAKVPEVKHNTILMQHCTCQLVVSFGKARGKVYALPGSQRIQCRIACEYVTYHCHLSPIWWIEYRRLDASWQLIY